MKNYLLLVVAVLLSVAAFAQLEVKEGSFKEVKGFVNINTEKMYDDNDRPYAVLKIKTENIDSKQRRELKFGGDAQTFFEVEYKDGEVWLYISYYATFLKISHEDLSSTEFWFPFDMEPKKGYELTLVNRPPVDEDLLRRIENLENASAAVLAEKTVEKPVEKPLEKPIEKPVEKVGYITVKSTPKGAWVLVDNKIVGVTPYLSESLVVGNHKIGVRLEGYDDDAKRVEIKEGEEVAVEFVMTKELGFLDTYDVDTQTTSEQGLTKDTTALLKGKFSVSSNKIVRFSKGNLQYNESTKVWRFAEHQWDVAGDKWVDLFDWDKTSIMNNNDQEWRVLSRDEWDYLLNKRNTNLGDRYVKAEVNGVNGIVLLPDNWNASNYELIKTNTIGCRYANNRISLKDWISKFEDNGAVFLPAAGHRVDSFMRFVGSEGNYWSSTIDSGNRVYLVSFDDAYISTKYTDYNTNGLSVRLVCDSE